MAEDWEKARDWLKQEEVTKMSAKVKNYVFVRCVLLSPILIRCQV